jgi:hypothetical protein
MNRLELVSALMLKAHRNGTLALARQRRTPRRWNHGAELARERARTYRAALKLALALDT